MEKKITEKLTVENPVKCWYCGNDITDVDYFDRKVYVCNEFDTEMHEVCLYNELKKYVDATNNSVELDDREIQIIASEIKQSDVLYSYALQLKADKNYHGYAEAMEDCYSDAQKLFYILQKKINGCDLTETWNLDYTLAKLIYPRLKLFLGTIKSSPDEFYSNDDWKNAVLKMINAFELLQDNSGNIDLNDPNIRRIVSDGLYLFGKHFMDLNRIVS